MPPEAVEVKWELASDEGMRKVVARGSELARPDLAHSVHVEVQGLQPGRWYWYRFYSGGEESPIGRTKTAPPPGQASEVRFAFASCQHYEQGFYTAYAHMAEEDLDLVLHLGDYIYENGRGAASPGVVVREHPAEEALDLASYRLRYAVYKSDPLLQRAHAAFPWIVTWDDHEVDNNYAAAISERDDPRGWFLARRAAAYQAYYEHQPLRRGALPRGPDALLYRTLAFGRLLRFHVLDTRQYRSDQACGDGIKPVCAEWSDPTRTVMGAVQERWLRANVERSKARWNVLAQQVAFTPIYDPARPQSLAMDPWSGYPAARDRLIEWMYKLREHNFVILSGDIHASFVMDVHRNVNEVSSPTVATEFIGTSITSGRDGSERWPQFQSYESTMPAMRYHDNRRGYVRCQVAREVWRADYRGVPFVTRHGAPVETRASFQVRAGRPGAVPL
jgi:alkaline phosphatase D